mmetsp:Transcript_104273/g.336251  ORF Transcript_104273/g.336251 Transcript_104273/m.336251 type:complete len:280 (+) Transcript_104273:107-946(+)
MVGGRRVTTESTTALTAMPATVQSPMATPPWCFTTALTSKPPAACSATGAKVSSCQPFRACPRPPTPPVSATSGTPHNASSRLKRALGRELLAIAACESAAPLPEQAAVRSARAAPEAAAVALGCVSAALASLPQASPPPPVVLRPGMTRRLPAATAQSSAAHCCRLWPSPISSQAATAQKTTFVWFMMLNVTPSQRRYAACFKRLRSAYTAAGGPASQMDSAADQLEKESDGKMAAARTMETAISASTRLQPVTACSTQARVTAGWTPTCSATSSMKM